jgi:hypothetical protein
MRDDGAEARMFGIYRRLAEARRNITDKLTDPGDSLTVNEREFLRGEKNRIIAEMSRLDAEIATAAAIAIVG